MPLVEPQKTGHAVGAHGKGPHEGSRRQQGGQVGSKKAIGQVFLGNQKKYECRDFVNFCWKSLLKKGQKQ